MNELLRHTFDNLKRHWIFKFITLFQLLKVRQVQHVNQKILSTNLQIDQRKKFAIMTSLLRSYDFMTITIML